MKDIQEKETYTMKELSEVLGINYRTAYRYCQLKEIPSKKIIGKWIIPKKAVDKFLKGDYFDNAKD